MSGLEPINMKDGGFPDLTGDGKVTQADILKGRGVEGFKEGGRPSRPTSTGYEGGVSQFIKDFIVDYEDPSDIALMSLYLAGPLGVGVNRGIKALRTAKKLSKGKQDYKTSGIEDLIDRAIIKKGTPIAGGAFGYDITSALLEDDDTKEMKEGGIVHAARGKAIVKFGKKFLDQVKKDPKLRNKDGSPKKSTKAYKDEIARQEAAKKTAANKRRAETRRRNQEAKAREEAERQGRLDRARANRELDRQPTPARTDTPEVGQPKPMTSGQQSKKVLENTSDFEGSAGGRVNPMRGGGKFLLPAALVGGATLFGSLMNQETTPVTTNRRNRKTDPDLLPNDPQLTDTKKTFTITGPGFNTDKTTSDEPQLDQSLMYYMKQDLANKGFDLDADTQTFTGDKKPTFFDYVKSLPAGYMDKVADDEDYAKKMMAGFLNMMKPVEGFVPINPAVAFGEGYLGEETRQADMLPADAKLLEYLKKNPGALNKLKILEATRAGTTLGEGKVDTIRGFYNLLVDGLAQAQRIPEDQVANYEVVYTDPVTKQSTPVPITTFTTLVDDPLASISNPNFSLKLKGT